MRSDRGSISNTRIRIVFYAKQLGFALLRLAIGFVLLLLSQPFCYLVNLIFCKCAKELLGLMLDCGLDELHVHVFLRLSPYLIPLAIPLLLLLTFEMFGNLFFGCQSLDPAS